MSNSPQVKRDERTIAVANASTRWAYVFLAYGLLVDVMYRGIVRHEAAWDLMTLVVVGGILCTGYQAHFKILPPGWAKKLALISCVAAVIAAVVAAIMVWSGR